MFFSIVIPLYNRPQEISELLQSLTHQKYDDFEVVVVEDGSTDDAKEIIQSFKDKLDIQYYFQENKGQGFARNFGFEKARGEYFVVFDSDVLVPENYLNIVSSAIQEHGWDAFGGADAAHQSFNTIQKAISYSMTSPLTTGGIRGNKNHVGKFHPRSFNMGISREVWNKTGGYKLARKSEDIEFSIRMINQGFRVGLIAEAVVYHKRRSNLKSFFKQTFSFGEGRIDLYHLYPSELKLVHALPSFFAIGVAIVAFLWILNIFFQSVIVDTLFWMGGSFLLLYMVVIVIHSWWIHRDLKVALLSILTSFTQLIAYGSGFLNALIRSKTSKTPPRRGQ